MGFFDRLVRPHFDVEFFEQIVEAIDGACVGAYQRASRTDLVLPSQRANAEGTDRYFAVQAAVMRTTAKTGGEKVDLYVNGFPIPVGRHKRFLVTACVTDTLGKLKRSKARRLLASLNGALEPYQEDLWLPAPPQNEDALFGLIVVARPRHNGLPEAVYFGVPSRSLQSWHLYAEISEVIRMFNDVSIPEEQEMPIRVPRLRKIARSRAVKSRRK